MAFTLVPTKSFKNSPHVAKGSSVLYKGKLIDHNGSPVGASDVEALTLALMSGTVIDLEETDILNTDRGELDSLGNLSILLEPEDTQFEGNVSVVRSMIITWTYAGGKKGSHRVDFYIVSLGV